MICQQQIVAETAPAMRAIIPAPAGLSSSFCSAAAMAAVAASADAAAEVTAVALSGFC